MMTASSQILHVLFNFRTWKAGAAQHFWICLLEAGGATTDGPTNDQR